MKKTLLVLFVVAFVGTLCFAQEAQAPVSQPTVSQTVQAPVVTKTISGKVDSVTIGDVTKGTKSKLVVVTDSGEKLSFVVKDGTPVTDKDRNTVALSDLKKDNKVTVVYTPGKMGIYRVQSIKLVE